mgnify:CR=1 FL=1
MAIEQSPIPKEELELFKQLKDLKVIFDVGARTDTDYLEIRPDSEHHLFEPNPEFAKELREKVRDKSNVIVNEFGLGDKNTEVGYQFGLQSFIDSEAINNLEARKDAVIQIRTLDEYIREMGMYKIDFLKIDTEGYDLKVLLGATNWYHIIKYIQYEHWGKHNDLMIRGLLSEQFDCFDIGYRNTFCISKNLVDDTERQRLGSYIAGNKLSELK